MDRYLAMCAEKEKLEALLKRYLDHHCQSADQEGMSTLCECKLCYDTRTALGMKVYGAPIG